MFRRRRVAMRGAPVLGVLMRGALVLGVLVLGVLMLGLPGMAVGQGMPDPVSDRVNDFADLLPPPAEARVAAALAAARAETGVQVVLVTLDRLAAQGGADQRIEAYAKRLFNRWGIGDRDRGDGILILVVQDDRVMRIALGAGYDSVWDNAAQRVIDRSFLPAFRENRYAAGIEQGTAATVDQIARPFAARQNPPAAAPPGRGGPPGIVVILLFALFVAAVALRNRIADGAIRFRACPGCRRRALRRRREVVVAPSADAAGRGVVHTACGACGWARDDPVTLARRQADRSRDFGGGGSSGGGASGRW